MSIPNTFPTDDPRHAQINSIQELLAGIKKQAFVPMPGGQQEPVAGASMATGALAGGGMAQGGMPPGAVGQGGMPPETMGMPPGAMGVPQGDPMAGTDPMTGMPLGSPPPSPEGAEGDAGAGGGMPPPPEMLEAVRQVVREELEAAGLTGGGRGSSSESSSGSGTGSSKDEGATLTYEVRNLIDTLKQTLGV